MAVDHTRPPCHECGSYDSDYHSPFCTQQTPEQVWVQVHRYYNAWLERANSERRLRERLSKEAMYWKGKFLFLLWLAAYVRAHWPKRSRAAETVFVKEDYEND